MEIDVSRHGKGATMGRAADTKRDIGHFEQWSPTYERSWMQRRIFDPAHAAALDAVGGTPTAILDIGCGTGRLLRDAHARWPGAKLFGVDPAQGMIAVARELTPDAVLSVGTAEALPLPDTCVDLAITTLSFHHWRDQAAGLRQIARVLAPGGQLILVDVSAPGWIARLFGNPRARDAHARAALLADAGLHVVAQRHIRSRFILLTVAERDGALASTHANHSQPG